MGKKELEDVLGHFDVAAAGAGVIAHAQAARENAHPVWLNMIVKVVMRVRDGWGGHFASMRTIVFENSGKD